MIEKASEIQAQAPCDATCNPTTHCCLDLGLGGGGLPGGSSGLPGGSSGLPGMDAGLPGSSTSGSGGIPGGGGGVCVSN